MKKYSARWVPRLLALEQKLNLLSASRDLLARFRRNQKDFVRRFITTDKTWAYHYTPEAKEQSKAMDKKRFPTTNESKNGFVSRKGCGNCFLGFSWNYLGRLISNKWGVLCQFVVTIKPRNQRERPSFAKE